MLVFLQVNIKVPSSTTKVIADYLDKHHIEVSAKDMYRNWGIILEKARVTLDVMTQMNVCSSRLNPINRYHTDILSQKLALSSILKLTFLIIFCAR